MKIDRIHRLRGCRIFRDFSWPGDLKPFAQFNLIYGWNGSGKTTLSSLFFGLEQGHNPLEGECVLQVDGQVRDFTKPDARFPNIRIFNKDTVSRAVFEMTGAQLAPVYVIGEENVDKSRQIEGLRSLQAGQRGDIEITRIAFEAAESAFETFCTDRGREIRALLVAPGSAYVNYDKSKFKATALRLQSRTRLPEPLSDEAREGLLSQKDSKPKAKLKPLPQRYPILPDLTQAVDAALKKSVTSAVIQELAKDSRLARWVQEGLGLHRDAAATCKFCGQTLTEDRIKHLEAHFNDEFSRFQSELESLLIRIKTMRKEIEDINPPAKEQVHDHLTVEYEKYRKMFMEKREAVFEYLDKMRQAVEAKQEKPFQVVDWNTVIEPRVAHGEDDNFIMVLLKVFMLGAANWGVYVGTEALGKLSMIVQQHNTLCDNFDTQIAAARVALEEDEVVRAMPDYNRLKGEADSAKTARAKARDEEAKTDRTIMTLEAEIQSQHSAAAQLTDDLAGYLGRQELKFESGDSGYTITRDGTPATDLSEGERTAIAFLYFLKSLSDTSFDSEMGIVVIDDPVSSLDANSIYCAFGYMKAHIKNISQIFVLTHDFSFFRLVKDWFYYAGKRGREDRYYMLQPVLVDNQRSAALVELDPLLSDYESEYHYLFKRVCLEAAAAVQPMESCYPMPNIARRLLEGFLAFKCPGAEDLHTKMQSFTFDEAKRARILQFVQVHSHHERMPQARHDPSILLETRAVMNDLLAFLKVADQKHYEAMVAATS